MIQLWRITSRPIGPTSASVAMAAALLSGSLTVSVSESRAFNGVLGAGPGIANHPVDVVPSLAVTVPMDWPVDDGGAITCLTCHTEIPPASDGEPGPGLRDFDAGIAEPLEFCGRCHTQPAGDDAGSMHWLALGVAHFSADRTAPRSDGRTLDANTRQCLSCHDGATASASKNATPWNASSRDFSDTRRNHPVGVTYDAHLRPKDLSPLRPASLLPDEVALPDGKVACVSCHNLYAHEKNLLTVPIYGSELCLTCHDMR